MTTHNGATENDFGSDEWRAVCSCGFTSAPSTEALANRALAQHYAETPKPKLCDRALAIIGPKHSIYGQNDSGMCGCSSCAGDPEEQAKALDAHVAKCPNCRGGA